MKDTTATAVRRLTLPEALQHAAEALSRGRAAESEQICRRLLAAAPGQGDILHLLGCALGAQGLHADALPVLRDAAAALPPHPGLLKNLSDALRGSGQTEEALAVLDRAVALAPDHPELRFTRGNLRLQWQQLPEAVADYEALLALKPDHAMALNNLGSALEQLKRPREALARFEQALALRPDYDKALHNLGGLLLDLKRYPEAIVVLERLQALNPDYPNAAGLLGFARRHACDWTGLEALMARLAATVAAGGRGDLPFRFLAQSASAGLQRRCAQTFAQEKFPPAEPLWRGERYRHDRIRIAYLSADFHNHATAFLMAELLEGHDRQRFETLAVSFGPPSRHPMRDRLTAAFDRFLDVRALSDQEIARQLRALEVDIAIDLKGYTTDSRPGILRWRPCPVQVNYLGYPGTMGADYIDYLIADPVVIPPGSEPFYSERVVRLPDCYQPNDRQRRIAVATPGRREAGLPENGFVFCCFNNNYKLTPDVFSLWMRLLHRVEGSVLWLLEDNAAAAANLRREAAARDIDPSRLVFAPRADLPDHLARHRLADLFLDTLPVNAHTTASDALWAGLPVLTCVGEAFAGRVAASLLRAAGLPELVTGNLDDYEAAAFRLASRPEELAALKQRLAANRLTCPLFDTDRYRRHLETAYVTMWERAERGDSPQAFDVPPETAVSG